MKTVLRVVFMSVMCAVISGVAHAENSKPKGILRAGFGMPYGFLGVNYEHPLQNKISLTAGLGYVESGVRWAAGMRIYFGNSYHSRLYFSGYHGVVDLKRSIGTREWKPVKGTAIGIGVGKRSWHLEVMYINQEHIIVPAFGWAIK